MPQARTRWGGSLRRERNVEARRSGSIVMRLAMILLILLGAVRSVHAASRVRVGVYENSPKVAMSESGKPEGLFIDLLEAIAQEEDWELEYVFGTWMEGLDRLTAGAIDLMPDVAYSETRAQQFAFHREPVLSDWFQIYARRGSGIHSLLDLAGKRVAVLERSVQQEAFEQELRGFAITLTLTPFADYDRAFAALADHDVDAVMAHRFYNARHSPAAPIESTGIVFSPTRLFFAAPAAGRTALLAKIDQQLVRMKQDPSSAYYRALGRWTLDDAPSVRLSWILQVVGLVAGGLLALSLAWSFALRRQVAARTGELTHRHDQLQTLYEEKSRVEQTLRATQASLEQRVQERTAACAAAMKRAESADKMKSAFLATMSHELRTPLNSIIGFTGILLQELAGPLLPEQVKQLRMVQASSRQLLALINDVLDISKIEAGQLDVSREAFDLRAAVMHAVETMAPHAKQRHLTLRTVLADDVNMAVGDKRRVEQVLMNLLSNAIKFTETGGVTVSGALAHGMAVISVQDTGLGIAAEDLPRLFHPFVQVDTGLSRQHEGTGLGLSICRRLLDLMGGTISAESQPGVGSLFTFRLPLHPKEGGHERADHSGH